MKIFYDHQALTMQRFGGISRYYYELIQEMNRIGGIETEISCIFSQNEYFNGYPGVHTVRPYHWRLVRFFDALNRRVSCAKIKRDGYDIIHPTYYDTYFLKLEKARKVVTIHDMTQEMLPEFYAGDSVIEKKKSNIYESDHIIAISNNTKKDILKIYPDINPDKITVIYHGSTQLNPSKEKATIILPNEYVLFVGARYLYKNFKKFLKAMRPIMDQSNIHIVCAGGGTFTAEERCKMEGYSDRVHQYSMSDADLEEAYKKATCFVFPSLYEGFGLPVLEAFQCGCPVVMSNTSSLPEVGGDAAEYFDPGDIDSMTEAIRNAIENVKYSHGTEEKRKRLERIDLFTWEKSAKEMFECYKRVCCG